ncbi:MAG: hypothetical protein IPG87_19745 [Saprospiraceae bacterium]|nr:hypothetical protein [Candidatus Vicinibacter affinis]
MNLALKHNLKPLIQKLGSNAIGFGVLSSNLMSQHKQRLLELGRHQLHYFSRIFVVEHSGRKKNIADAKKNHRRRLAATLPPIATP